MLDFNFLIAEKKYAVQDLRDFNVSFKLRADASVDHNELTQTEVLFGYYLRAALEFAPLEMNALEFIEKLELKMSELLAIASTDRLLKFEIGLHRLNGANTIVVTFGKIRGVRVV